LVLELAYYGQIKRCDDDDDTQMFNVQQNFELASLVYHAMPKQKKNYKIVDLCVFLMLAPVAP